MKLVTMIRVLAISLLCIPFYSCKEEKEKGLFTPLIAKEILHFCNQHEGFSDNGVLRDKANQEFSTYIIPKIKNGSLNDYIFELNGVKEFEQGHFAAHFDMSYLGNDYFMNTDSAYIHGDVIGLIDSSLVTKLKEKEKYKLKGSYERHITINELKKYSIFPVWSPLVSVEKKDYSSPEASLGVIILNIKSVEHINQ